MKMRKDLWHICMVMLLAVIFLIAASEYPRPDTEQSSPRDADLRVAAQDVQYDAHNHGWIVEQASLILAQDGKPWRLGERTGQRPDKTYRQAIIDGVILADDWRYEFFTGWWRRHAHNPRTHRGWTVSIHCPVGSSARSGANEAQSHFDEAVVDWWEGRDYDAMVSIGFALHFVQDASVPHHAAGTPESIAKYLCGGNGAHDRYENWVRDNYNHPDFPHAPRGGIYTFAPHPDPRHYNPNSAWGWVDKAAHEGIHHYPSVRTRDQMKKCDSLPDPDTSDNVCYDVARYLVRRSERMTAGFINFFLAEYCIPLYRVCPPPPPSPSPSPPPPPPPSWCPRCEPWQHYHVWRGGDEALNKAVWWGANGFEARFDHVKRIAFNSGGGSSGWADSAWVKLFRNEQMTDLIAEVFVPDIADYGSTLVEFPNPVPVNIGQMYWWQVHSGRGDLEILMYFSKFGRVDYTKGCSYWRNDSDYMECDFDLNGIVEILPPGRGR